LQLQRGAVTLVELMVVLSIIGVLLALLLPAVHAARERARETVCKNNVYQLSLAIANFTHAYKRLPGPHKPNLVGGWSIEILPFLEQKNLADRIAIGTKISEAESFLLEPPRLFRCPSRGTNWSSSPEEMSPAHYALVPLSRRESYMLFETSTRFEVAWASGPELSYQSASQSVGPHHGGLYYSRGFQQGISFMQNGKTQD
jgi:prepilin-type N-terminal cleavage/methylation domain-containing protein